MIFFVLLVSFVAHLCVLGGPVFAAITLLTVQEEIEIGRQANAGIRKDVPELTDRDVKDYLRAVGAKLVKAAPGRDGARNGAHRAAPCRRPDISKGIFANLGLGALLGNSGGAAVAQAAAGLRAPVARRNA